MRASVARNNFFGIPAVRSLQQRTRPCGRLEKGVSDANLSGAGSINGQEHPLTRLPLSDPPARRWRIWRKNEPVDWLGPRNSGGRNHSYNRFHFFHTVRPKKTLTLSFYSARGRCTACVRPLLRISEDNAAHGKNY